MQPPLWGQCAAWAFEAWLPPAPLYDVSYRVGPTALREEEPQKVFGIPYCLLSINNQALGIIFFPLFLINKVRYVYIRRFEIKKGYAG